MIQLGYVNFLWFEDKTLSPRSYRKKKVKVVKQTEEQLAVELERRISALQWPPGVALEFKKRIKKLVLDDRKGEGEEEQLSDSTDSEK